MYFHGLGGKKLHSLAKLPKIVVPNPRSAAQCWAATHSEPGCRSGGCMHLWKCHTSMHETILSPLPTTPPLPVCQARKVGEDHCPNWGTIPTSIGRASYGANSALNTNWWCDLAGLWNVCNKTSRLKEHQGTHSCRPPPPVSTLQTLLLPTTDGVT